MAGCKINALSLALLVKALLDGPHNQHELAAETGLHVITIRRYVKAMEQVKALHICAWDRDPNGRAIVPVYKMGPGKKAPRVKMTPAQRQAKRRAKKKALKTNALFAGPIEVTHE